MSEIIGVKSLFNAFKNKAEGLKRELLLFDKVAIDRVENFFKGKRHQNHDLIREVRWLYEQGLVIACPDLFDSTIRRGCYIADGVTAN